MDHQRFDAVTRKLAKAPTRRKLVGMAFAGMVAAVLPRRAAGAQVGPWGCPPGYSDCGYAGCVSLATDRDHCGACFSVCESDLVPVDCRNGQCVRAECAPGMAFCGIIGGCSDLVTDPLNCGECGVVCDSGVCSGGICAPAGCPPWLTDCGAAGCVDLSSDLDHCGACYATCASDLVAVTCQAGSCIRDQCGSPDLTYCGIGIGCRDLMSDPESCGGCGIECAPGYSCWLGACV